MLSPTRPQPRRSRARADAAVTAAPRPADPPRRRLRGRTLGTAAAITLVGLLVGACGGDGDGTDPLGKDKPKSSQVPGPNGSAPAGSASGGVSSAVAQGGSDPRTVDPCSFVTRDTFANFAAKPSTPPAPPGGTPPPVKDPVTMAPGIAFNKCEIAITASAGGVVDVSIDYADLAVDEKALAAPGEGVTVHEANGQRVVVVPHEGDGTTSCQRAVVDKQLRGTQIEVKGRNDMAARVDVCAIADAVVDTGIKRVNDGAMTKRTYGPKTFTTLKACDTVGDATLTKVVGTPSQKMPDTTGFGCSAGVPQGAVVLLKLGLKTDPPIWEKTAQQIQVAGRQAMLEYEEESPEFRLPGRCTVTTVGVKLPQSTYVEIAEAVFMHPTQSQDQLCAAAKDLANEMFAKLPK